MSINLPCLIEVENMNTVIKSARGKEDLISLLRLRRILLKDLLLKNVKEVHKIKLLSHTTTKTICSNGPIFFRGGPKFNPLLQMGLGTVATHPPLKTPFVGAAHPTIRP